MYRLLEYLIELHLWIINNVNYALFCNGAIAFLHYPGIKTAHKQAEKLDV
ncbi:hypothetical protein [Nostoc sp.]